MEAHFSSNDFQGGSTRLMNEPLDNAIQSFRIRIGQVRLKVIENLSASQFSIAVSKGLKSSSR